MSLTDIIFNDFKEAIDRAEHIPVDELKTILNKPPVSDRGADHRWRDVCAKYNIVCVPEGKTKNVKQYFRDRRRDEKILRLEQRIKELEEELRNNNRSRAFEIARKLRG